MPDLSAIPEHHSGSVQLPLTNAPLVQSSKSIAFGLNRVHHEEKTQLSTSACPELLKSSQNDIHSENASSSSSFGHNSAGLNGSTASKSSFQKNAKTAGKVVRPTRFEPKTLPTSQMFQSPRCGSSISGGGGGDVGSCSLSTSNTLPATFSAPPLYGSCLCLSSTSSATAMTPPTPQQPPRPVTRSGEREMERGGMSSQGLLPTTSSSESGSASIYSGSSTATLPMNAAHAFGSNSNNRHSLTLDPTFRHRYLTYGTSAQLQQEYGKVLPWPTLTEFRLRRKFRRLKRRARKLIGGNLFSSKSFLIKRFVKRRSSIPEGELKGGCMHHHHHQMLSSPGMASRSSSLTSLLDLIEEANKNIINSYNCSPGPSLRTLTTAASSSPPKCPPRLKRTQSSINVNFGSEQKQKQQQFATLLTHAGGTMPNCPAKSLKPLIEEEQGLWRPKVDDYQIAFIEQPKPPQKSQQQAQDKCLQVNSGSGGHQNGLKTDPDAVSVKSLDSYFGPASLLPSVSGPLVTATNTATTTVNTTSPQIERTQGRAVGHSVQQCPGKSKSRTLMVRSHFEINNGTIYLEDSDWEMCSEVSELNSLNHIETQVMDSSLNDHSSDFNQENAATTLAGTKSEVQSKSSLESSKMSLQSSSSTSGFSEPKSDVQPLAQLPKCSSFIKEAETLSKTYEKLLNVAELENKNQKLTSTKDANIQIAEAEQSTIVQSKTASQVHEEPANTTALKNQKPEIPVKPKLPIKPSTAPTTTEPIYAKPNKSKYPPKHCCIARPAQPPPETPKARSIALNRQSKMQINRKKVKAPAPPPPPLTSKVGAVSRYCTSTAAVSKTKELSQQKSANTLKLSSSSSSSPGALLTTKSNTISATTPTTAKKTTRKISGSRLKLNLTKRNNCPSASNVASKSSSSNNKSSTTLFSASSSVTKPPNVGKGVTAAAPRSASKSPLKALINRLTPRNQEEGRTQAEKAATEKKQIATTTALLPLVIEQSNSKSETNDECNRAQSPAKEEPIYSNVNNVDSSTFVPATAVNESIVTDAHLNTTEVLQENALNSESNVNVSVVNLIDKFNKLNQTLPESPEIGVTKVAQNNKQPEKDVCFPSVLSTGSSCSTKESKQPTLENEFQQHLQQLCSSSSDNIDKKQIIDQLCSELIHKFEQTKSTPNEVSLLVPKNICSPSADQCVNSSALCSTNFANPNWLFLFFLHNQRQMFKEILHEMLSTIQNQNQAAAMQEKSFANSESKNESTKLVEMNEFKQLIQMLQSTVAAGNSAFQSDQQSVQPVTSAGAVTANVITPVIVTETKEHKNTKKSKGKDKKAKEKKNSLPKNTKEAQSEKSSKNDQEAKNADFETKDENCSSADTTVKSSNRFVNKIVLNNSINQFNFTMNQDGATGQQQQPNPPQASIVNVFSDQSSNQAANVFDINVNGHSVGDDEQSHHHKATDQTAAAEAADVSAAAASSAPDHKNTAAAAQHRTVLQIKDASGRSSNSSGFLSSLRYRLEKKRNKKLLERFKKEQLAASQLSLLDAIKEAEESTAGGDSSAEPKVTLANTSKLEVKVDSEKAQEFGRGDPGQQHKMSTLRRLLLPSRGGARGKKGSENDLAISLKLNTEKEEDSDEVNHRYEDGDDDHEDHEHENENDQSSDNGSVQNSNSSVVSKLEQLVARHRNSRYVPQISEPCPTGLEYTLHGTMRRSGDKGMAQKYYNNQQQHQHHHRSPHPSNGDDDDQNEDSVRAMSLTRSAGHFRGAPSRTLSERNFRSISVIKLNELPEDCDGDAHYNEQGVYGKAGRHRLLMQHRHQHQRPVGNYPSSGRLSSASAVAYYNNSNSGRHPRHPGHPQQQQQQFGGSQLNLSSTSSLSSSVLLIPSLLNGPRGPLFRSHQDTSSSTDVSATYANVGMHNIAGKQQQQQQYASSDDFDDDEQSTTSSRQSKMVTFTLPRSFKPKSRTTYGGANLGGGNGAPVHLLKGEDSEEQQYIARRYNLHRYQQQQEQQQKQPHKQQQQQLTGRYLQRGETNCSETDANDETDFTEETETETDEQQQYCLSRCRLNERYFRHKQR